MSSGEHNPSQPESPQSKDDAGQVVQVLEFVFFITVVAIGAAALHLLVGRVAELLIGVAIVLGAFTWRSRDKGTAGQAEEPDNDNGQ